MIQELLIESDTMATHSKIIRIEPVTHDVFRLEVEKPAGLKYLPGQAADISLNKKGWEKELRAFTFTSHPDDKHLEFTIKTYPGHHGLTAQIQTLIPGDELIIHDVFGDIQYKGEGIFIAGGAGVTPFLAIFKDLERKGKMGHNSLIFANKTRADIIMEEHLQALLGKGLINVLSLEEIEGYRHGYISAEIIRGQMNGSSQFFYLCGPDPMMQAVGKHLENLGLSRERIVREAF